MILYQYQHLGHPFRLIAKAMLGILQAMLRDEGKKHNVLQVSLFRFFLDHNH